MLGRRSTATLAVTALAAALSLLALLPLVPLASASSGRTVIGHSLRGRAIVAIHRAAADPALTVLLVGAIHGNETAGMAVARRLARAAAPRGADLWVVPTVNPDGVAAGTRGNARGVDLNRNFPFRWRHLGGLEYSGSGPLSEPESRAAVRLIRRVRPDVTIWFHQPLDLVDRSGGEPFPQRRLADLLGLPLVRLARYPGSASSWQNHALPRTSAFVVELPHAVDTGLVRRATAAVRSLAAELASPALAEARAR